MKTLLLVIASLFSITSFAQSGHGSGDPGSTLFAAATLSTLGSFESEVSPVYTRIAVIAHATTVSLQRKEINVTQAKAVLASATRAKELADKALLVCGKESKTGPCKKNSAQAHHYLEQAQSLIKGTT